MLQRLTYRQSKTAKHDLVRSADGPEKYGVELLQCFDAICRHQRPEFLVALRAPIEIGKIEGEAFVAFRTSQEYFNGSRDDFLSYPVAGDGRDIVPLTQPAERTNGCVSPLCHALSEEYVFRPSGGLEMKA